jgi:adenine-specific DNA-methyltransferase
MASKRTTALAGFRHQKALARAIAERCGHDERLRLAKAFCQRAVEAYWAARCASRRCDWRPPVCTAELGPLSEDLASMAGTMGTDLNKVAAEQACFLLSSLYTVMLPDDVRALLGAYYTPPALVKRLLDLVTEAGLDWAIARVLDPACGGGAFLAPVGRRMLQALKAKGAPPEEIVRSIGERLRGFEIDPFAAWMSQAFLELELLDVCLEAGTRLPALVSVGDALALPWPRNGKAYDLVIGNPPYGKVTLPAELRERYARSLYGHANLYGLFTELAVRWTRQGGFIAYVTPTSFLGGQYFKALRALLLKEAPPLTVDFVTDRTGVFEDVLQETMLTVYRRAKPDPHGVMIHFLRPNGHETRCAVQKVGRFLVPPRGDPPWLLPRQREQVALLDRVQRMPHSLANYGFSVSTGPLVWNRHKKQLKTTPGKGRLPLVWSEAVGPWGFRFTAERREHTPFIEVYPGQEFLVTRESCMLVQRTTAKEQKRRLVAAVVPQAFVEEHGGIVVENHLNVIRHQGGEALFSLATLCTLLGSAVVDQVFRCINGSVAVSAYELEALPLPAPEVMAKLEMFVTTGATAEFIEGFITRAYGVQDATSLAA